jgi:hypothetical protein
MGRDGYTNGTKSRPRNGFRRSQASSSFEERQEILDDEVAGRVHHSTDNHQQKGEPHAPAFSLPTHLMGFAKSRRAAAAGTATPSELRAALNEGI